MQDPTVFVHHVQGSNVAPAAFVALLVVIINLFAVLKVTFLNTLRMAKELKDMGITSPVHIYPGQEITDFHVFAFDKIQIESIS